MPACVEGLQVRYVLGDELRNFASSLRSISSNRDWATGVALVSVPVRRTRRSVARTENMMRDPMTRNTMVKLAEGILGDVVLICDE